MKETIYYQSGDQKSNLNAVRSKAVANASIARSIAKDLRVSAYNLNPKLCANIDCKSMIPYDKKSNNFCSHQCSAKVSNASRDRSFAKLDYKKTLSCTLCKNEYDADPRRSGIKFVCDPCKVVYPHTKVHCTTCKFCQHKFYTNTSVSVCKNCQHLKWQNNKSQYSFTFNIWDYPDLFDLDLLKSIGWVSFGGKRGGIKNLSGLSRDHKVSVSDAKKHGYDPYYISHPCNCELLPHHINNSKNTNSSISYEELVTLVDEYDSR